MYKRELDSLIGIKKLPNFILLRSSDEFLNRFYSKQILHIWGGDNIYNAFFDEYDFAIMIYLNNKGNISPKVLALDAFIVEFFGKSSHAAQSPWTGKNALNAVRLLFDSVDELFF